MNKPFNYKLVQFIGNLNRTFLFKLSDFWLNIDLEAESCVLKLPFHYMKGIPSFRIKVFKPLFTKGVVKFEFESK